MEIALLYLVAGIVLLTWSSDKFIIGSINIAKYFRVSPLLIGLTIVSLGTSAPEIMVSIMAALHHQPNLAIANVLGSNIANVGLVLGVTAAIKPITVESKIMRREFIILALIICILVLMFFDGYFSRYEGYILFGALMASIGWFVYQAREDKDALLKEFEEFEQNEVSLTKSVCFFIIGASLLPVSAHFVVRGASSIAELLGISAVLIGLTIVAIGTSLPEAAASITASFKGEQDIAIGNVIGSNMLNIVAVLPFVAVISPGSIDSIMIMRDLPIMIGFTAMVWIFVYLGKMRLSRVHGILLLLCYAAYLALLINGEINA